MSQLSIPIIDVSPLLDSKLGPDHPQVQTCAQQMHQALRETGFLYIKNHGILENLQNKIFDLAKNFFAEDQETKMQIAMPKAGLAWRGYFPVGGELTSGRPDQKEGIYFGTELPPSKEPLHGPNQWPRGEKYSALKPAILEYLEKMTKLSQHLMEGAALGLGLPRNYFTARFTNNPTTLFRIFNYPKHLWSDAQDEWGVREHTDMGFLTILKQDNSGGLQAKARNGEWIVAPPIDGTFVINIGDMLEVWTHGIYRATPHRVRNEAKGDRLSLPFFFDPNWRSTLEPVEKTLLRAADLACVSQATQDRWDGLQMNALSRDMEYGNFVWKKVSKVFPDLAKSN